ncbi:MAG: hypothetical protein ABTQ28_18785 [Thauera sp.]
MSGQLRHHRLRQHRHPILRTFAVAEQHFASVEIQVFHAQADKRHQAHAGAVRQASKPDIGRRVIDRKMRKAPTSLG